MLKWIRQLFCWHKYNVNDMIRTGSKDEMQRIMVACRKCGHIKHSYCGINIVNEWTRVQNLKKGKK